MTDKVYLQQLRIPTIENPLRILMSACLCGVSCGYNGTTYGDYPKAFRLQQFQTTKIIKFCPEDFSFGTPRELCDIHGGNGLDVLKGTAKVLTETGKDWTDSMIKASEKMLEIAIENNIEIAVMMDISAACGSQVIYKGSRLSENKIYQIGMGVCAAQLIKNGFHVISQRDFASLDILYSKIDLNHKLTPGLVDHHETEWYVNYFSS